MEGLAGMLGQQSKATSLRRPNSNLYRFSVSFEFASGMAMQK